MNFPSTREQKVTPLVLLHISQGTRRGGEGVLVNEDTPPLANVPACICPGPQRGQLGDTFIFIFISISLHAVPFPVSDTARA